MLSLDLTAPSAADRNAGELIPCNTLLVQRLDATSLKNGWQQHQSSKLIWVLQGSMVIDYGPEMGINLRQGMYAVLDNDQLYRITGSKDVRSILIGQSNAKETMASMPENTQKAPRSGDLINDLSFAPLVVDNHVIQLVQSAVFATEEACLDSDKAFFILQGTLTVADEMDEETLSSSEMVCIKANTYHRIFTEANTTAITIQRGNTRVNYWEEAVASLN